MGVPYDPTIPLLDIDPKEIKSHIKISYQIDPYLPMLTPILFTSGKTQKLPVSRWKGKERVEYRQTVKFHSTIRKESLTRSTAHRTDQHYSQCNKPHTMQQAAPILSPVWRLKER